MEPALRRETGTATRRDRRVGCKNRGIVAAVAHSDPVTGRRGLQPVAAAARRPGGARAPRRGHPRSGLGARARGRPARRLRDDSCPVARPARAARPARRDLPAFIARARPRARRARSPARLGRGEPARGARPRPRARARGARLRAARDRHRAPARSAACSGASSTRSGAARRRGRRARARAAAERHRRPARDRVRRRVLRPRDLGARRRRRAARPAHRAAQPPGVHDRARAGDRARPPLRPTALRSSSSTSTASRRSTTRSAIPRATACSARLAGCCASRCGRPTSPGAWAATSSRPACSRATRRPPGASSPASSTASTSWVAAGDLPDRLPHQPRRRALPERGRRRRRAVPARRRAALPLQARAATTASRGPVRGRRRARPGAARSPPARRP